MTPEFSPDQQDTDHALVSHFMALRGLGKAILAGREVDDAGNTLPRFKSARGATAFYQVPERDGLSWRKLYH
jgi:hypothetical protein